MRLPTFFIPLTYSSLPAALPVYKYTITANHTLCRVCIEDSLVDLRWSCCNDLITCLIRGRREKLEIDSKHKHERIYMRYL